MNLTATHGMSYAPEYSVWVNMRQRCNNPNHPFYEDYGGRGIRVCEEWNKSFELFYRHMGPRPKGFTIERKNNNGNYERSNCCWATPTENNRNKRKRGTCARARRATYRRSKKQLVLA